MRIIGVVSFLLLVQACDRESKDVLNAPSFPSPSTTRNPVLTPQPSALSEGPSLIDVVLGEPAPEPTVVSEPTAESTVPPVDPVFSETDAIWSSRRVFAVKFEQWLVGPRLSSTRILTNDILFKIANAQLHAVQELIVHSVNPWFPERRHGVPRFFMPSVSFEHPNVLISNFGLIEKGLWELKLDFTVDGVRDELVYSFILE